PHRIGSGRCVDGTAACYCASTSRRPCWSGFQVTAEQRYVVERMERFPCDPLRVARPVLVAARVAACDVRIVVDRVGIRGGEAGANTRKLVRGFRLHTEMIQPGARAAMRNREVDARIV